jgi:hypothetical protein
MLDSYSSFVRVWPCGGFQPTQNGAHFAMENLMLTSKDIERMLQETPARMERALALLAASRALLAASRETLTQALP